jgi:hypothetical protein
MSIILAVSQDCQFNVHFIRYKQYWRYTEFVKFYLAAYQRKNLSTPAVYAPAVRSAGFVCWKLNRTQLKARYFMFGEAEIRCSD